MITNAHDKSHKLLSKLDKMVEGLNLKMDQLLNKIDLSGVEPVVEKKVKFNLEQSNDEFESYFKWILFRY